jgi:hypothetical protein
MEVANKAFATGKIQENTQVQIVVITDSLRQVPNLVRALQFRIQRDKLNIRVNQILPTHLTPVYCRGDTRLAVIDLSSANWWSDPEVVRTIRNSLVTMVHCADLEGPEELIF